MKKSRDNIILDRLLLDPESSYQHSSMTPLNVSPVIYSPISLKPFRDINFRYLASTKGYDTSSVCVSVWIFQATDRKSSNTTSSYHPNLPHVLSIMSIAPILIAVLSTFSFSCLDASLGYLTNVLNIPITQIILLRTVSLLPNIAKQ
jgi:hypothetical protein